jgi:hypothetical protein
MGAERDDRAEAETASHEPRDLMKPNHPPALSRVAFRPPSAAVIPFPLSLNRQLIARLVKQFLAIPPSPERAAILRQKQLAQLRRKLRALSLPPDVVEAEIWGVEQAMAVRLTAIYSTDEGAARNPPRCFAPTPVRPSTGSRSPLRMCRTRPALWSENCRSAGPSSG